MTSQSVDQVCTLRTLCEFIQGISKVHYAKMTLVTMCTQSRVESGPHLNSRAFMTLGRVDGGQHALRADKARGS